MTVFRTFKSGDERGIISLWNAVLAFDPITLKRFRNQVLLDANFDPDGMIIAEQNGEVAGALLAIRRRLPMSGIDLEKGTGWITFFMVKQDVQREGIGHGMMDRAFRFLKKQGVDKVFFASYAPNYFLPGIDRDHYPAGYEFLRKEGFSRLYSPVAMHRSLADYSFPEEVKGLKEIREKEGYSFMKVSDGDLYDLICFAKDAFNPDWGRAIREGLLQGIDSSQIMITKKNDEIVGFAMFGGYEMIRERFGPFGVSETEQGKGLGKILLHEILFSMKQLTIQGAWFLWTSETSSAGHLYRKNGFTTHRTFQVMMKELT
ncbi:GNAT superfamily N-acetyltransferase [Sporosarcina luteola]|nr:GNAT superfamily N-acetyltransferase [Sporosarcina luteola]